MDFKELLGNLSKASVCLWVNSGILRESEGVRMERYTPEEKQEKTHDWLYTLKCQRIN